MCGSFAGRGVNMIRKIFKYEIQGQDRFTIQMPKGAVILCVQVQDRNAFIWAEVDPVATPEERVFELFITGGEIFYDMGVERKYIGTFQACSYVYHLYERIN